MTKPHARHFWGSILLRTLINDVRRKEDEKDDAGKGDAEVRVPLDDGCSWSPILVPADGYRGLRRFATGTSRECMVYHELPERLIRRPLGDAGAAWEHMPR